MGSPFWGKGAKREFKSQTLSGFYVLFLIFQQYLFSNFTISQSKYICNSMSYTLNSKGKNLRKSSSGLLNSLPKSQTKAASKADPKHFFSQTKSSSTASKKVFKTRSLKKKQEILQISFEVGFMEEHEQIFDLWFKNLLEQTLKNINQEDINSSLSVAFGRKIEVSKNLVLSNKFMSAQESSQFQEDLQHEEKLEKFLKVISNKVPKQFAEELIFVAFLCWEKYIQVRKPIMQNHQLLCIAEKFAQDVCKKDIKELGIRFLNFKEAKESEIKGPEGRREIFINFMRVYIGTVFFIIEEYFENPYQERKQAEEEFILEQDSLFSRDFQFGLDEDFQFEEQPSKKFKYE